MGIADARAMYPALDVAEAEPAADRRLLQCLADCCDRYTPLVALDGDTGLFLDITGCTHLFDGEAALLHDLLSRFLRHGFAARAGIASTPGTAWAAARLGGREIVEPGAEADILAPLPLVALRLDAGTRAGLESVGLRTVGAVMAAPRAPLVRRFGKTLLMRLDQALGSIEEALSPRLPVPSLCVERRFADPLMLIDDIERLLLVLASALKQDLERRGEGARLLELLLFRVDGAVSRISVGSSRPIREAQGIHRLFRERLATVASEIDVGFGFDLVRLSIHETATFEPEQVDLVDASPNGEADLCLLADRLRARLGEDVMLRARAVASHVPERAVRAAPIAEILPPRKTVSRPVEPERPIRLFSQPEPIDVPATEVPEGAPLNFRWRRAHYRVARSEGPERIASEWWRENTPTRDYYRVEDGAGRRYWLYRQGFYGAAEPPRWFMHGIFA